MDARLTKAQAIVLAEQFNVSVIPLLRDKKKPAVDSWRAAQSSRATVAEIANWGASNLGIVTGAISGLVVVDCESKEDARWFWRNRGQASVVVETPRGVHLYFRHPGSHIGNRTRVKDESAKPRYDIRGDGGYVVAPPSEVVADGEDVKVSGVYRFRRGYEMRHPETLEPFKLEWSPLPATGGAYSQSKEIKNIEAYISRITAVSGSGGHSATYKAACYCRESGLPEVEALYVMQQWNRTNADPPWTDAELLHKVRWAYGKGGAA